MLSRLEIDSSIVSSVQYCSLKSLRPLDLSPTLVSSLLCNSFLLRVSKNTKQKSLHYIGPKIARSRSVAIVETHRGYRKKSFGQSCMFHRRRATGKPQLKLGFQRRNSLIKLVVIK
jgi:hypothetical protein